MTTAGFGSKQPIADNKTAAGRKLNRRIEIKIQQ
jgi:outer membrane protein OmpA-like peptidoglycan-associated protein